MLHISSALATKWGHTSKAIKSWNARLFSKWVKKFPQGFWQLLRVGIDVYICTLWITFRWLDFFKQIMIHQASNFLPRRSIELTLAFYGNGRFPLKTWTSAGDIPRTSDKSSYSYMATECHQFKLFAIECIVETLTTRHSFFICIFCKQDTLSYTSLYFIRKSFLPSPVNGRNCVWNLKVQYDN